MDVEIDVPQTPVVLVAGAETRVGVQVRNRSGATIAVRLSVAPNRAGAWAHADPAILEMADGECADADVIFRPPTGALAGSHLLPYTVRAEDLRYATTAGRTTGLLTLTRPERLRATMARDLAGRSEDEFLIDVSNRAGEPLTVRIEAELQPPQGRLDAHPSVVDVPAGRSTVSRVRVRPHRPVIGSAVPYTVVVTCRDAADDTAPPVTVQDTGTIRPRLGLRTAFASAVVLVVLAVGGALVGWGWPDLPDRRGPTTPPPAAEVRTPYALLEVYPRQERAAAEAALARLSAAGAPARLVDGAASAVIGDEVLVIVQDGLASVADAQAYCDRIRAVAPKCTAFP